jgi:hypothetical protein
MEKTLLIAEALHSHQERTPPPTMHSTAETVHATKKDLEEIGVTLLYI